VTCTNGEGSGLVVPGTGIHVNNVMGEQDLNPLGFFTYPPGRRMPSMMAPTVVMGTDGEVELVLGSAGSNRIRSAILQVIVGVVDHGQRAHDAVLAPRAHFEDDVVYVEPGIDVDALRAAGREVLAFRDRNLFFGGAQAVERDPASGALSGAGDPRRGGARWPRDARGVGRARGAGALAALAISACGSEARDLFLVTRTGDVPGARLTLRVTDDGPRVLQRQAAGGHHERPAHHRARERARPRQAGQGATAPGPRATAGLLLPRAHRGRRGGVERRLGPPAGGALQAGPAHARRGEGPLSPGALARRSALSNSPCFRLGRRERPVVDKRQRETHGGQQRCRLHGPGEVEVQSIDFPKLELQDGPGVHPDNVGRKTEHGVILKIVSTNICGSGPAHGPRSHDRS
jgi:hypothetical protein